MARKKKKTKESSQSRVDSVIAQLIENPSVQLLGTVLLRFGLIVGVAGLTFFSLEVEREVQDDPRFQLKNWNFEFGQFPEWVTPRIQADIESIRFNGLIGPEAEEGHIFQENLLARLRERLAQNSWIQVVNELKIRYPGIDEKGEITQGGLLIDMNLRRPIAIIQLGNKFYYSDERGICLGEEIPHDELAIQITLPIIRGGESFSQNFPLPLPGENWKVRQILEGIEVAHLIHDRKINQRFPRNPIIEIDISNVGGVLHRDASEIKIVARGPKPIEMDWGRSPISPRPRTSSLEDTLKKLEWILENPNQRDLGQTTTREAFLRLDLPGPNYLHVLRPEEEIESGSSSL